MPGPRPSSTRPAPAAGWRTAGVLALAVLLVAALGPAPVGPVGSAAAQSKEPVDLDYAVTLLDPPDAGVYEVEARFSNLEDRIDSFDFHVGSYEHGCEDGSLSIEGRPDVTDCDGAGIVEVEIDDDQDTLTYRYRANLDREANQGGFNAVTEDDWALLQASSMGFQFSYSFFPDRFDGFSPRLTFDLPAGWQAEGSFVRSGATFVLEPEFPRPAGMFVLGSSLGTSACDVDGHAGLVVEVEPADQDVCGLVHNTTGFLRGVHGDHAGPRLLYAVAPDPFKNGGIASRDAFAVRTDVGEQTIVHELVHVWQRYETCNVPEGVDCYATDLKRNDTSGSTVWLKEGAAEFYSALALYAGGHWAPSRVQEFFDRLHGSRYEGGALSQATYGSSLEDAAYTKGALVLALFDEHLKERTNKTVDLATVFADLNDEAARELADNEDLRESNEDFEARLERLAGETGSFWDDLFAEYVYGADKPPAYEFRPTGTFRIDELAVDPDPPVEEADITASFRVTNTGLETDTLEDLPVYFGGAIVHNETLTLGAGNSTVVEATFPAPPPGRYALEVGTQRLDVRVLAKARLTVDRVTTDPFPPRAEEPYEVHVEVVNGGDLRGTASVSLRLDGAAAGVRSVDVAGQGRDTAVFAGVTGPEGPVNATVVLVHGDRTETRQAAWEVGPPRPLLDVERIRRAVPGPGAPAVLAALAAAVLLWHRVRGPHRPGRKG